MSLSSGLNSERLRARVLSSGLDFIAFAVSASLAFQLRFDGHVPAFYQRLMWLAVGIWAVVKVGVFIACGVNRGYWRYTSVHEAVRIVAANSIGSIVGSVVVLLLGRPAIPRSIYVMEWFISSSVVLGGRLTARVLAVGRKASRAGIGRKRTLIYGAGAAALALVRELEQNQTLLCDVIGLIDDDPRKVGMILHGKKVLGSGSDLGTLATKHAADMVLIAIPSATGPQMVRILKLAIDAQVDYKTIPGVADILHGTELGKQIRDVAVEDLLGRQPVHLDEGRIRARIEGKVVMVTGAAGSIGSEICRQIAQFNPTALIGFDQAETPLFQLERELNSRSPHLTFHPEIGNITRPDHLRRVMQRYHPSILYHAAAYKHVPMMEKHIFAAVENNIFGTWNIAVAALANGIKDVVMISSDKAVRPTSMMGATKRAAELVIRALHTSGTTAFLSVRFGNVLGSSGSVVPIFKEQIASGGPVTITHPEMRRYFMTIPEAAQLVLQAFAIGAGGEVFVLDMGNPVRIVDLARNLIMLSGLEPDRDIKIEFTGLRPGEKMFEELNLADEDLIPTSHTKIRSYIGPVQADLQQVKAYLQELRTIFDRHDVAALVLLLKDLIPDYNPGSQLLKDAISNGVLNPESDRVLLSSPLEGIHIGRQNIQTTLLH